MKRNRIDISKIAVGLSLVFAFTGRVSAQTVTNNYVKETLYGSAVTDENYNSNDPAVMQKTINYIDGLGRTMQTIRMQYTPQQKDFISINHYDNFGREAETLLGYPSTQNSGAFISSADYEQMQFFQTLFPGEHAYAQTMFDNSPLNKTVQQRMPGSSAKELNAVSYEYETNTSDIVKKWMVNNDNQLVNEGFYAAGTLFVTKITDENGHITREYKDFEGKIVQAETEIGSQIALTCHVYDRYGFLRYVLSPEASEQMTGSLYASNHDLVKKYCYYYQYNGQRLMSIKQLPGAGTITMEYNTQNLLIKTTDASGNVNELAYDALNRPTQTNVNSQAVSFFYYENYTFFSYPPFSFDYTTAFHQRAEYASGLATGSRTRILGTDKWLISAIYYDQDGRIIQTRSDNLSGGMDIVNTQYDFMGRVLKTVNQHNIPDKDPITLTQTYTYDHIGRLLKTIVQLNTEEPVVISENTYNELEQLQTKGTGQTQNVSYLSNATYTYTIRGWLKTSISPLFTQKLHYNDGFGTAQRNGNISGEEWTSTKLNNIMHFYKYSYDPLNRLTGAETEQNLYNMNLGYDLNGNIENLTRFTKKNGAAYTIDNLTYTYTGNQIQKIDDAANKTTGFIDGATQAEEYNYDAKGNMTRDLNKKINQIDYNAYNLPTQIVFSDNSRIENQYTASGHKTKEMLYNKGNYMGSTLYDGAFVYKNTWLAYILIPDGRIVFPQRSDPSPNKSKTLPAHYLEYQLKDHLGNVRITFTDKDNNDTPEIQSENHYYPFGMPISALSYTNNVSLPNVKDYKNDYFYNGKELITEFGLNWEDYGWRNYDAVLGRWWSVDPLGEKSRRWSPYSYAYNNPLRFIDPDGREIVVTVQQSDQERKPELEQKYKQTVSDAFKGKVSANIDKDGKVSFSVNKKENGKEFRLSKTEKAAFNTLNGIANDQENTVTQTLMDSDSKGAAGVDVGSWTTGAIDMDDIAAYGTKDDRMTSKGKLVHETYEQQQKEIAKKNGEDVNIKGPQNPAFQRSHAAAITMENQCQYFERTKDVGGIQYGIAPDGIEYMVPSIPQGQIPDYQIPQRK